MTLSGFETLFYTLAFLVPGFLLHLVISMVIPHKAESTQLSFLRFLTLSCLNYALWSWLIWLIFQSEFFSVHPGRAAFAWTVIILIGPLLLGLLLGHFHQRDVFRRALQRIGINPIHGIATSWDYKFSRTYKAIWMLVTLTDGSRVGGLFGSQSFASSDAGERDLYLQEVWKVRDDGPWQRSSRSAGIWIRGDQIKHIEFWSDEGEQ